MSDTVIMVVLGVATLVYFVILATAHVWMVPREHLPKGWKKGDRKMNPTPERPEGDQSPH